MPRAPTTRPRLRRATSRSTRPPMRPRQGRPLMRGASAWSRSGERVAHGCCPPQGPAVSRRPPTTAHGNARRRPWHPPVRMTTGCVGTCHRTTDGVEPTARATPAQTRPGRATGQARGWRSSRSRICTRSSCSVGSLGSSAGFSTPAFAAARAFHRFIGKTNTK